MTLRRSRPILQHVISGCITLQRFPIAGAQICSLPPFFSQPAGFTQPPISRHRLLALLSSPESGMRQLRSMPLSILLFDSPVFLLCRIPLRNFNISSLSFPALLVLRRVLKQYSCRGRVSLVVCDRLTVTARIRRHIHCHCHFTSLHSPPCQRG